MPSPRHTRIAQHVNEVQEMVNALIKQIFSYEVDHLAQVLKNLVLQNQSLGGTMNAFIYNGSIYSVIDGRFLRGLTVLPLHRSLLDEAESYTARKERVERDNRRAINSMSVVALKCTSRQDVRDVLPETLIGLVPELSQMERIRPEGFLLKHSPVLMKQYQDTLDLLLDYQANRLIY